MTVEKISNTIRTENFDHDGSLGIKINNAILSMTNEEIEKVSRVLSEKYPGNEFASDLKKVNHIATSIVLRTLFGPLTRNGLVLDCTHPDRKDGLAHNLSIAQTSWEKPFYFINCLEKHFAEKQNHYGLTILYEMLGHRYGDLAVVSSEFRQKYLDLMEETYKKSYQEADIIKCMKQLFSPWYWGALYFTKLGIINKAIEWHKKYNEMAMKYMFDGRGSYTEKTILSLNMLRNLLPKQEWKQYLQTIKRECNNPHYGKAFGRGKF